MKKIKPPFLTTAFSERAKNAKIRLDNIMHAGGKRLGAVLFAIGLIAVLCAGAMIGSDSYRAAKTDAAKGYYVDKAIHEAIIGEKHSYADAEFLASGCIVLGAENIGENKCRIYAETSQGGYNFMNGMFVKYSGTGAIPAVITVKLNDNGEVRSVESIEYPKDGAYYEPSLRKMFPPDCYAAIILGDSYDELKEQEHVQARSYLESIGRGVVKSGDGYIPVKIGDYKDLDAQLPNMSTEASNTLMSIKEGNISKYPMFVGNIERIEYGKRYIYNTIWSGNETGGRITYLKTEEDGTPVEEVSFDIVGNRVIWIN